MPHMLETTSTTEPERRCETVGGGSHGADLHRDARAPGKLPSTKAEVAELSIVDVHQMSCEELAVAIRAADVPLFQANVLGNLKFYDRTTLEQLMFLARRTVRNQGY